MFRLTDLCTLFIALLLHIKQKGFHDTFYAGLLNVRYASLCKVHDNLPQMIGLPKTNAAADV